MGKDSVMLHIWDTAGQERFHALAPLYYRDAKVRYGYGGCGNPLADEACCVGRTRNGGEMAAALLVQGALLVYDITDRESFERMQNWLRELKKLVGSEICIVIAGNKIDQRARQQIPESEAKDFAAANNAKYGPGLAVSCRYQRGSCIPHCFLCGQALLHVSEGRHGRGRSLCGACER